MDKKKILIVDDDAELGEELVESLEAEGYSVATVSDGPKSLKLIRKNSYDIFLLDYKMQGVTGLDLVREIRKKDSKAAVFLVSGRPGLGTTLEQERLDAEVREIIEKPFDLQQLLEKLGSC